MGEILCRKTPWKKEWCGREGCQPCQAKPGCCRTIGATYKITCQECAKTGTKTQYIGETARSFWDRSREHLQALEDGNMNFAIVKHWKQDHGDLNDPPAFKFETTGSHQTAISRQLTEALNIEEAREGCDKILNGKGEYGGNKVPRLKITVEDTIVDPQDAANNVYHTVQQHSSAKRTQNHSVQPTDSNFDSQFCQRKKRRKIEAMLSIVSPAVSDRTHTHRAQVGEKLRHVQSSYLKD